MKHTIWESDENCGREGDCTGFFAAGGIENTLLFESFIYGPESESESKKIVRLQGPDKKCTQKPS